MSEPKSVEDLTPEQRAELQEKLKNMSPEQLAELQQQQCIFCQIISGKVDSKKIYEDDDCIAVLDIYPAVKGHIILVPKEHFAIMPQVPEKVLGHLFTVSKKLSQALLKGLRCTGTNIFIANGLAAGQKAPHFLIHILPRKEGDTLLPIEEKVLEKNIVSKVKGAVELKLSELLGKPDANASKVKKKVEKPKVEKEEEPEENDDLEEESVEDGSEEVDAESSDEKEEVEEDDDSDEEDNEDTDDDEEESDDEDNEDDQEDSDEEEPEDEESGDEDESDESDDGEDEDDDQAKTDATLDDIAGLFK